MPCAEIGAVKFFDERPGKKFGFALVLDNDGYSIGEEIFFHYNEGEFVYDEEGIPTFGQAIKYKYSDAETKSTAQSQALLGFEGCGAKLWLQLGDVGAFGFYCFFG
jgi:hypothetical protein